jgi:hypothetical protein
MYHLKLFTFKRKFLKMSIDLHTALATGTHPTEGQWLEEQLNMVMLLMFREGTRIPTFSA